MTTFDARVLPRLIEDTDSRSFVLELARTYCRLLPGRIDRITEAVGSLLDEDGVEELLDATRSLRGASLMTGAVELAQLTVAMEGDLQARDVAACRLRAGELPAAAARADAAIAAFVAAQAIQH